MTFRSIAFLLCVGFLLLHQNTYAQLTASGVVYDDTNRNGSYDQDEKPLEGIGVSNGKEVVLTNREGRYTLTIDENDASVFVIKPAGFKFPLNKLNQPQFFYIHKPNGSPDLRYKGVEPTGPLPTSLNFPLYKSESKDEFKVLLFGDPQPYNQFIGRIGTPWFNVYGNHDMNFDVQADSQADETFEATFGPATYSFDHGKAHFIILDDVVYPRTDGRPGYIGGLTSKQLSFI